MVEAWAEQTGRALRQDSSSAWAGTLALLVLGPSDSDSMTPSSPGPPSACWEQALYVLGRTCHTSPSAPSPPAWCTPPPAAFPRVQTSEPPRLNPWGSPSPRSWARGMLPLRFSLVRQQLPRFAKLSCLSSSSEPQAISRGLPRRNGGTLTWAMVPFLPGYRLWVSVPSQDKMNPRVRSCRSDPRGVGSVLLNWVFFFMMRLFCYRNVLWNGSRRVRSSEVFLSF